MKVIEFNSNIQKRVKNEKTKNTYETFVKNFDMLPDEWWEELDAQLQFLSDEKKEEIKTLVYQMVKGTYLHAINADKPQAG